MAKVPFTNHTAIFVGCCLRLNWGEPGNIDGNEASKMDVFKNLCRIRTDHNEDETLSMLSEWTDKVSPLYSSIDLGHEEEWLYASREPLLMTEERYTQISQLRQEGLEEARTSGAHYLLVSFVIMFGSPLPFCLLVVGL